MAEFETLGHKSANSYLQIFVKGLGTEFIDKWVGKHAVNFFSVVQLSTIAATKLIGEKAGEDEAAVSNMSKDLYPIILKRLEELEKIDREKRGELQTEFTEGQELVDAFLPLSLELAKLDDPKDASNNAIHVDDSNDGEDDANEGDGKDKKKKLTKIEKKALKLEKAMAKKAKKIEKKNAKLQAKINKLSVSLSGNIIDVDGDGKADEVSIGVSVDLGGDRVVAEDTAEETAGETTEETTEEEDAEGDAEKDDLLSTLASALNLDASSPVMSAVLALAAKNKVEAKATA